MKPIRMRRNLVLVAGVATLALPAVEATAATRHASTASSSTFTGATVAASQWGTVTVNITAAPGKGAGTARRFTNLGGGYTYHTPRSQYIMSQALPLLRQEFLAAQSARIQNVAGATLTSQAFTRSLQSALLKAHV